MVMETSTPKLNTFVSDPVADMLTRIRNANLAKKDELFLPVSKMNEALLKILSTEGFVGEYAREGEGVHQVFRVQLKYDRGRQRTITGLRRISRPGRRVYARRGELPRVLGGLGIAIISTSQGVMTDRAASKRGIGGEVLAYVW
jgi:small subunit ribosomal protein S8